MDLKWIYDITVVFIILLKTRIQECLPTGNLTNTGGGRIIGGQDATKDQFPWQAMLLYHGSFLCGASILNEWTVLTAAHCVEFEFSNDVFRDHGNFTVRFGEHTLGVDEQTEVELGVEQIIIHPCYNITSVLANDIAIIHLNGTLTYGIYIQPVVLSRRLHDSNALIKGIYVGGWGLMSDYFDIYPDVLQIARVRLVNQCKCSRKMGRVLPIYPSNICTYNFNKAPCSGDSGGPMGRYDAAGNFVQLGVVSWGVESCLQLFTVYARVPFYIGWIRDNMKTIS